MDQAAEQGPELNQGESLRALGKRTSGDRAPKSLSEKNRVAVKCL
jgi:hypothetical protein